MKTLHITVARAPRPSWFSNAAASTSAEHQAYVDDYRDRITCIAWRLDGGAVFVSSSRCERDVITNFIESLNEKIHQTNPREPLHICGFRLVDSDLRRFCSAAYSLGIDPIACGFTSTPDDVLEVYGGYERIHPLHSPLLCKIDELDDKADYAAVANRCLVIVNVMHDLKLRYGELP